MAGREPRVEIDNGANGPYQLIHLRVTETQPILNRTVLISNGECKGEGLISVLRPRSLLHIRHSFLGRERRSTIPDKPG